MPTKRATCPRCRRPQSTCICKWIAPVSSTVQVLILQHPLELDNAKGSARLLHLCLPNSRMVISEVFDASVLTPSSKHDILLYPDTRHDAVLGLPTPPPHLLPELIDLPEIRLIVLDATWRKSRKMLYRNPTLHLLPRMSLQGLPASSYRIRKAHRPHQLSTLEATCAALAQLEGDTEKYQPLLDAFDGFVAQQMGLALRMVGNAHHESADVGSARPTKATSS